MEINDPQALRCRQLWCEVLRHALIEILTGRPSPRTEDSAPVTDKLWLYSRDFRMICALAGIDDHEDLRERVLSGRITAADLKRYDAGMNYNVLKGAAA